MRARPTMVAPTVDEQTRMPGLTISVGPGHHVRDLVSELAMRGAVRRVLRQWPSLIVEDYDQASGRVSSSRNIDLYGTVSRVVWGAWRRLPIEKRHQHPQTLMFSLFDRYVALNLGAPELFLGWAQVSAHSLRAARKRGAVAVLEHPMVHVDHWQDVMLREYAEAGPGLKELYNLFSPTMVARMKREYQEADFIVVPSSTARETFRQRGVPAEKLLCVPYGIAPGDYRPAATARTNTPFRLLCVGRLELLKGVQYVLRAWKKLGLENAELWLAGRLLPEFEPVLAQYAGSNVRLLGELEKPDLAAAYADVDAVAFPSLNDGFGLVILEAMAAGVPVIASLSSGGPDAIEDGREGFLVPSRDAEALADRISWLHAHRQEAVEMGQAGRERVLAEFTIERYGERMAAAIRTAYGRAKRARRAPLVSSSDACVASSP